MDSIRWLRRRRPAVRSTWSPTPGILAVAALCAALLALPVALPGQDRAPDERPGGTFSGETTVVAVEVPVQVTRNGEPVRGLTAADFRVYQGGERRELTGFEVVDLGVAGPEEGDASASPDPAAAAAEAARPMPPAARRCYLLFFDMAFSRPQALSRAEQAARDLLAEGLRPSDLVGVAFYGAESGLSLVLQCTPDRRQVDRVLDGFRLLLDGAGGDEPDLASVDPEGADALDPEGADALGDPLDLSAGGWKAALASVGRAAGYQTSDFAEALGNAQTGSSPGDRWARNILSHSAELMEQAYRERRGSEVADLANALEALARATRPLQGSKYLVLFSQGWDADLLDTISDANPEVGSGGGIWIQRELDDAMEELRRSGWVIHGLETSGPGQAALSFRDGLFFMANETGGELVANADRPGRAALPVIERSALTYLLTFQVDELPVDGAFHPVRVELVDAPKGTEVHHRKGFFAPAPAGEEDPLAARTAAAARLLAGEEVAGVQSRVRATALHYAHGRAAVPVVVEVPASELPVPRAGAPAQGAEIELYLYAFGAEGRIADFLTQAVKVDGVALSGGGDGAAPAAGVKLVGALELAPGAYELRALIRVAPAGGAVREAVRLVSLEVPEPPAADARRAELLPPMFVQGGGERWVVAVVGGGGEGEGPEGSGAYPFTVEGKRIAPAALPVLSGEQIGHLLLPGFGLTAEGSVVVARVVDAGGQTVEAGRIEWVGRGPERAGQPGLLIGRVAAESLAPGDYRLEIAFADGGGASVSAPFRVAKR